MSEGCLSDLFVIKLQIIQLCSTLDIVKMEISMYVNVYVFSTPLKIILAFHMLLFPPYST